MYNVFVDVKYLNDVLDRLRAAFKSIDTDMLNVNLKAQDSIISVSLDSAGIAYDSANDRMRTYDYAIETYINYRSLVYPGSITYGTLWYVKRYYGSATTVTAGGTTSTTDYWYDWTRPDMRIVVGANGYVSASGGRGVIEIYVEGQLMATIEYTETTSTRKYAEFILRKDLFVNHIANHPTEYRLEVTIQLKETSGSADFTVQNVDIYMTPALFSPIIARDSQYRVRTTLEDALASVAQDRILVTPDNPPNLDVALSTRASETTLQQIRDRLPTSLTTSGNLKVAIEEDALGLLKDGGNVNIANFPTWQTTSTKTTDDIVSAIQGQQPRLLYGYDGTNWVPVKTTTDGKVVGVWA